MTLIIGGVKTPFTVNAVVFGEDHDLALDVEADTFGEAKAALEAFIIDNQDVADDYLIGIKRVDVFSGDIVRFAEKVVTARDGRQRTKHINAPVGVWAISWRKPEPSLADLRKAVMAAE